jgi:hypothetical protein
MAYELTAIIGQKVHLERECPNGLKVVRLPLDERLAMVPLTSSLFKSVQWPSGDGLEPLPKTEFLLPGVHAWLVAASREGMIGYIEVEYWGGMGTQLVYGWNNGALVYPTEQESKLNGLLALLGVKRSAEVDEWDTVGMGRHRHTEEWLT